MAAACCQSVLAAPAITFASLLNEMIDRDVVARWPDPAYTCAQASSYDRRSKTPSDPAGWFANEDWSHFIRSEEHQGRREWVMMDADGPGAVVRFWTGGKLAIGTVRFYLDGAAEPAFAAQLQDLLCGRGIVPRPLAIENPKQAGNSYLPIPYARSCKITYQEADPDKSVAPPPQRWYNIEYRTYPAGTPVKSFCLEDLKSAQTLMGQMQTALPGGNIASDGQQASLDCEIEPGNLGNTVVTRTRSLDAIPFAKSLQFDMEVWHWADCQVGYAATTYWYAQPGATSNRGPAVREARREIPGVPRMKGAIECEAMPLIAMTDGLSIQKQAGGLSAGNWSGGTQLFARGTKPGLCFPKKALRRWPASCPRISGG